MTTSSPSQRDKPITSIWKALITPSPSITEPSRRRQARLLAILHVAIVPFGILLCLYTPFLPSSTTIFNERAIPQFGILIIILLFTYWLSRTSRYELGAAIALGTVCVHIFLSVLLGLSNIGFELLYSLILVLMVFNLFFSIRLTFIFGFLNIIVILLLPRLMPDQAAFINVLGPITFLVLCMCVVWLVSHQRDLLEQERHEELAANQKLMRLITDNVNDIVTHLDAGGTIRFMSPSLLTLLGYPPDMTLGQTYHVWLARVHPDDKERVAQTMEDVLQTGKSALSPYRIQHADGQYRWMEPVGSPLYTPGGSPNGMILVTRDITQRKRAEEALQASEARFRVVADTVDAGILITREAETLYANPAAEQWFGYSFDDLKSVDRMALVHPDSLPQMLALQKARRQGLTELRRNEVKVFHKDGDIRWIHLSTMTIQYEGQPATIATFFDITETKLAEERRLELTLERGKVQLLQQFIRDLSHDLRNPLAMMSTSVYLLNKASTPEKRQYHADVVAAQMTHLEKVLEDLMNISQLEKEGNVFSFRPLDLNQLVEKVVQEYQPTADAKNQHFTYTLAPDTPQIMAEQQQLSRALSNVVSNALSYTPQGGEISVRTQVVDGQRVEIIIEDNGIGIEPHDLPLIFNHFYRADKARSTDTGRAGLGLTIAQRIILSHGGKIDIKSEYGGGSTVSISLPLVAPEG